MFPVLLLEVCKSTSLRHDPDLEISHVSLFNSGLGSGFSCFSSIDLIHLESHELSFFGIENDVEMHM